MDERVTFWLRLLSGLLLSALSVVALLLALPPCGLWPLVLVSFVPMLVAQYRILPARLSSLGPAVGMGGFIGLYIISIWPSEVGDYPWFAKTVPMLILMALFFFTEKGDRALHERTGYRWFVWQGALVWVGVEMIRSLIPGLGTGAFVAYAYAFAPWLIQPISIFGIFGLSLVTMLVAYGLALGALAWLDGRWRPAERMTPVSPRLARHWLVAIAALALCWAVLSLLLDKNPATPTVRVAAIQTGGRLPSRASRLDLLSRQTRQAAADGAQVVVWPEGALDWDPQLAHTGELRALARETGAYIVIGYALNTATGLRNEATILSPGGQFLGVYGKDHPVTLLGETSISRGAYPVYDTPLGKLGTLICFDLVFTDSARRTAAGGAQLVGLPSNDWRALADIEYTHLVFRAVENRMAMVKADTQYDSAVIDPYGRIVSAAVSTEAQRAVLVANVALGTASALQIRLGDWIGWLCVAGLAFFALPNPLLKRTTVAPPG